MRKKISKKQAVRFGKEVSILAKSVGTVEFSTLLRESMKESVAVMYESKKNGIKNSARILAGFAGRTAGAVVHEVREITSSPAGYLHNAGGRFKATVASGKQTVTSFGKSRLSLFKQMSFRRKRKFIADGAVFLGMMLLVGGGTDFEGGAPDLDTRFFGIGGHRNILTHSILWGLALEFMVRVVIRLYRKGACRLPADRSAFWNRFEKVAGLLERHEDAAVGGLWAGMALHLLQDASLVSGSTKPYTWLPGEHAMGTHQGIFAGNSFFSFMFSGEAGQELWHDE